VVHDAKFVGSSAGSLICLVLALGLDFEKIRDFQLDCVDRTHGSITGAFRLKQYVGEIMVGGKSKNTSVMCVLDRIVM
jgi:hypothetical protein